jgi:hypothetical protein
VAHEPCSACGQKFFGRSIMAYPALMLGPEPQRRRIRLCPQDAITYLSGLTQHLVEITGGNYSQVVERPVCRFCGQVDLPDGTKWVFVTIYPKRNERRDFAGLACPGCVGRAGKEVLSDAA